MIDIIARVVRLVADVQVRNGREDIGELYVCLSSPAIHHFRIDFCFFEVLAQDGQMCYHSSPSILYSIVITFITRISIRMRIILSLHN